MKEPQLASCPFLVGRPLAPKLNTSATLLKEFDG
jgi:hypothetical protein